MASRSKMFRSLSWMLALCATVVVMAQVAAHAADDAVKPAAEKQDAAKPTVDKPADSKPAESKPTESKPTESKPTESKPTESKPTESKPAESKPAEETPAANAKEKAAESPANAVEASVKSDDAHGKHSHGKDAHGEDAHGHGAGGHGHHDPTDLSHANAGPHLMKLMPDSADTLMADVKSDLAIYTFIVFLLLFALLAKFAWGPIAAGLAKREQAIADMIAQAKANSEKSEQMLKEYQVKLAAAQDETRELLAQARRDGESLREKIVGEAQTLAQRERDRAVADIGAAKNVALNEIAQKSVDTAVALAGRILRKELRPQEHAQLIRESLEKFPSSN